ncbi:lysyl-tRNA synthetase, class 2 [Neorhodopirellula lusitana]|uniref:Lysyl-tRNA synthetase, class 2 n=1 Tax=Neorhodopirellula lusitana TaxID=445327 RepID=A0ABY1QPU4_9BACT|nr:EF-P lysine aminoacylase EpmA [Neorhodopirellula lusitana]SMP77651.1 lysyl-tRNA synthetase, class 2 [Neorhodopirellula lusitana]
MTIDFATCCTERDRLLREIRGFFHNLDFCEVQPPCLSRDCVVDAYLDPIGIPIEELGLAAEPTPILAPKDEKSGQRFLLQTSPESAMKRMLAAGAPSIFAIAPVFRKAEMGSRHNIEFTMLEWYERGGDAASAIQLLGELARIVFNAERYQTVSYQQAFSETLHIDPIACSIQEIQQLVDAIDSNLAQSLQDDRDGLLDVLLSTHIEPELGRKLPTILTRYPISQAALARPCEDDPRLAERFELFYRGVELANGYDELLDPDELVRRYETNNQIRQRTGRDSLPTETTLVQAMRQGFPKCSGVAVGVDRILMLRLGANHINEVMPFTTDIA